MKRDWYDPDMRSACLYAERKKSVKASTLWSMKAGVSSIIAQKEACSPEDFVSDSLRLYVKLDVSRGKEF